MRSMGAADPVLPQWSPAGDWIAYSNEDGILALVSPDGKRHRTLSGGGPVTWSATGRFIYQVRYPERALSEVDPVSGHSRKVRDLGFELPHATHEPGRRMSLTPGGKSLVYSVLRPREEIWLFKEISKSRWAFPALADRLHAALWAGLR